MRQNVRGSSAAESAIQHQYPVSYTQSRIFVMQSNGGLSTASRAAKQPVRTILSGPAGGVVASARLAQNLGLKRAVSFDMGGTSTDVCLLDGPPRTTNETSLAGLPVAVPVLDVHSVGAGGGSLARIDAGGALRVGHFRKQVSGRGGGPELRDKTPSCEHEILLGLGYDIAIGDGWETPCSGRARRGRWAPKRGAF